MMIKYPNRRKIACSPTTAPYKISDTFPKNKGRNKRQCEKFKLRYLQKNLSWCKLHEQDGNIMRYHECNSTKHFALNSKCKHINFTTTGDNLWIIPCNHIRSNMKKKKIVQQPLPSELVKSNWIRIAFAYFNSR